VDEQRHVLYASSDFGVLKLRLKNGGPYRGSDKWRPAGPGLPAVAVPDLTILPDRGVLLAATHGFGAWTLKLQG